MKRWLKRILVVLIAFVLFAAIALAALRSWERALMQTKSVRELTGIVTGKGYRKFTKENATRVEGDKYLYWDDESGHLVQRYPGDEDWLLYYEVESFDRSDEPMTSRLLANEKKRVAAGQKRTAIVTKDRYDQINVGQRIFARYQRFSESDVMIWGCETTSQDAR